MTEIVEAQPRDGSAAPALPANSPMAMMLSAIQQGITPEQIHQMMDVQERWAKGEAKKAYDAAFAAFKAEAVRIIRGRDVTDGPLKGKSYAELHDVVNAVTPALSKHGLSSSWKLTRDEDKWMEVTCYLRHVGGHEESVSMGGPPDAGGAKNAIQARASTKTYLERYTLKAITGLSEQHDDTDGNPPSSDAIKEEWVTKVAECETSEALDAIWASGCEAIQKTNDLAAFAVFKRAVSAKRNHLKEQ